MTADQLNAAGDVCTRIHPVDEEAVKHRPGCSAHRGRDCICAYLRQWDATGYLAPTFRKDLPMPERPGHTTTQPDTNAYRDMVKLKDSWRERALDYKRRLTILTAAGTVALGLAGLVAAGAALRWF